MVGDDHVDDAIAEGLPEGLLVGVVADGWGALEEGCSVRDVFGGEVEVMGAGFDGDGEAFGACSFEVVEGEGGGEMDDVEAEVVLATESDHQADGFELGLVGAGLQVGGVASPVGVLQRRCCAVDGAG